MECQRCLLGKEAKYRVYTDIIDMKVCAECADEARSLGIAVEIIDDAERKNDGAKSEPKLKDCRLDSWIIAAKDGASPYRGLG